MKFRKGFVSNSSSSSYIVAFKRIPQTMEELKKMLFGKKKYYVYDTYETFNFPTEQIAQKVFNNMQRGSVSVNEILDEMDRGSPILPGVEEYSRDFMFVSSHLHNMESIEEKREFYYNNLKELTIEKMLSVIGEDCHFYIFEYSDGAGSIESAMEHGDLFEKLPHIKISKH